MALLDVYGRRATIAEVINFLGNLVDEGRNETREIAGLPGIPMYIMVSSAG